MCVELVDYCLYVVFEVGVDVVYFVDVGDVWDVVFVCLLLDCFGLWFYIGDGVEECYSIVEYV